MQGTDPQSIDAELALQRKLAKQLGIKGKSAAKKADPADNLDEFLTGDTTSASCYVETFPPCKAEDNGSTFMHPASPCLAMAAVLA